MEVVVKPREPLPLTMAQLYAFYNEKDKEMKDRKLTPLRSDFRGFKTDGAGTNYHGTMENLQEDTEYELAIRNVDTQLAYFVFR